MGWAAAPPRVSSLANTPRLRHRRKFKQLPGLEVSLIMLGDMKKAFERFRLTRRLRRYYTNRAVILLSTVSKALDTSV
jgi:hypothetical protein